MIFLELTLQNFGPYRGKQVINLRPQMTGETVSPIVLLGGMNGGGKTTLMDAMRLVFYGARAQCSTRGNIAYPDFLKQAINKHTPPHEMTCVELLFEHILENKQVEFRIQRRWNRHLKNGKDTLGILIDDWPDKGLVETWDERVEDFFPLGISNLFLFDGEQVKELAELDSPPSTVIQAIQSLLGLELAERLSVDLNILVSRKRKELAEVSELATLEAIESKLNEQIADWEEAKLQVVRLDTELQKAHKRERQTRDKFRTEGGKVAQERDQIERQLREEQERLNEKRDRLREMAAAWLPLALIQPLLERGKVQGEKEIREKKARIAREVVAERDRRLLEYLKTLDLGDISLDKVRSFLESESSTSSDDSLQDFWLDMDEITLGQLTSVLEHQLPNQISQTKSFKNELIGIQETIVAKERQLNVAAPPEVYEELLQAVSDAGADVAKVKRDYDQAIIKRDRYEAMVEKTKKELSEYSQVTIDRKNANHIIQTSERVQKTLVQFREKLTLRKLNKLEIEVTECFRYLLHKSDLVHRVVIATQDFSLSLYDPQGQPVPKHRLSAGEKQLLAIAFLWGLARVSGRQLPIAIDTPLGRLDSSHRYNLIERYFPSASHQVILLSTDTEIGEPELKSLRQQEAIAREYLLKYDPKQGHTTIVPGYFINS
ncbi:MULTISPECIES: DNA sulfur modification protein DndD [Limnospira]|uniref:Nuclease SbcCD subunit C n=1 Tax=Limnospira maxima CS-328 TaxID=513049 RepID=B5W638_LIMMA|nr:MULTISPECIES: DNA sulfur modification protein DndD [Limnospira]MDC0838103.1 DNA sulfur modification protein DndD [Limnoraphis robusta]MDY7051269.1 DNA sulfur modification protein DndD [Limnospira fusiformis LS22]QJB28810.1 DNA sulfur modification protein DndD [Limnospira fusiformis SAG 85.79]EDZ93008.1 conserved hypothetical protein [Limnospira maxima CS-328]MDT9198808.1 DNA sulfur modification protein DndD [Limnospira sp. PMC 1042.18]